MKSIIAICSMLLITITATSFNTIEKSDTLTLKCIELKLEECELTTHFNSNAEEPVKVEDIYVYEVEEEVAIDFDTTQYLPNDFNALKGIGDLDWKTIELVELEEEVTINFDTKQYLPKEFNSLKGMYDLDWDSIELVELQEEVTINFDTKQFLPKDFNSLKGMYDLDWNTIELIEIEEEVDIDFNAKSYTLYNNNDHHVGI